jgi:hypothetical protein
MIISQYNDITIASVTHGMIISQYNDINIASVCAFPQNQTSVLQTRTK